ncbi:MAG: crotonase/enoyl-CoA hydratase family protein [Yoonia sp.]|nr:crotonase/enoyl-CoA hydratase family protein [Yoonia sp.]
MTVTLTVDKRGVASLMLNRPDKHNAMSAQMISDLTDAAQGIAANADIRIVVLGANGPSFCAGGDLNWMRDQMAADRATRRAGATALAQMLGSLNTLPQPVIGRIHGNAFGGGIGLACICDVAIGVTGAKFGLTETKLGLIPATIGPYVLARMGEAYARRVFMSSRVFDASEAEIFGIIAKAVTPETLDAAIEAEVTPYLNCAPNAVAAAKALARRLGPKIDDATVTASIDALITAWDGTEASQGIAAFFAKQPPPWAK